MSVLKTPTLSFTWVLGSPFPSILWGGHSQKLLSGEWGSLGMSPVHFQSEIRLRLKAVERWAEWCSWSLHGLSPSSDLLAWSSPRVWRTFPRLRCWGGSSEERPRATLRPRQRRCSSPGCSPGFQVEVPRGGRGWQEVCPQSLPLPFSIPDAGKSLKVASPAFGLLRSSKMCLGTGEEWKEYFIYFTQ